MIGIDLSAFMSQIFGGNITRGSWVMIIAVIIIVVLILNFTSSVLTMMTLGNLHYKFGAKGNPIMLSPEYRVELNTIKGLFVSIIVLVTILTLRLFLSPEQMSYGIFDKIKDIPAEVSKYGHFVLCLVVFGLMTTIIHVITPSNQIIDKLKVPDFPSGFKYYFQNLFYVLMGITLLYVAPVIMYGIMYGLNMIWPFIPSQVGVGPFSFMNYLYTKSQIPVFEVFIGITSLLLLGLSAKLQDIDNTKGEYSNLSIIGLVFSIVLFCILGLSNIFRLKWADTILQPNVQNSLITLISCVILFTLSGVSSDPQNSSGLQNKVFGLLDFNNITESYILSKIVVTLLILFPLGSFISMIRSYMWGGCGKLNYASKITQLYNIFSCIFTNMSSGITVNTIELFNLVKGILIVLAFVFSGLTINEYAKNIAGTDKYNMYQNKFQFNLVFGICMIFLLTVLSTSFFNTDNFPVWLAMLVEYLAPVIILGMASYLVYYANDLAKLSKQEVLNDVQIQAKNQRELPDLGDKNAPIMQKQVFDGTTPKI